MTWSPGLVVPACRSMDPEDPGRFPKWAPIFSLIVFLPLLALHAELFHTISKKSLPKVLF